MKSMMSGKSGNKTLRSTRVYPRGEVDLEGVQHQIVPSNYIWQPIKNTKFSVCVVIALQDKDVSLIWNKPFPADFVYHRDFRNRTVCNHFGRPVTQGISSVKFTPDAFLEPWEYMEGVENNRLVDHYYDIMTGHVADTKYFKASVPKNVALSAKLNAFWKESGNSAIWLYLGTVDGIFRKMPSAVQPYGYDHKLRPWYQRTLGQKGLYTLSVPYVDASGTGIVLTLGRVIYEGKKGGIHGVTDPVIGVLAMDFPVKYIYHLLLKQFPECEHEKECFILDNTGFIIVHPDFFKPNTNAQDTQSVHITMKEPEIANDLITKNRMVKEKCTDFGEFQNQLTYLITLKDKNIPVIVDEYEIHAVQESNLFLVRKRAPFKNRHTCYCHFDKNKGGMPETRECNKATCECPCHSPMEYNQCRENFTRTLDDYLACTPALPPGDSFGPTEKADTDVPFCQSLRCSDIKSKRLCTKQLACNWCSKDTFGKKLDIEYCSDNSACNPISVSDTTLALDNKSEYTTISLESHLHPSALNNGAIAGICIAVILLIVVALVVVFFLLKNRREKAKLECTNDNLELPTENGDLHQPDAGVDNPAQDILEPNAESPRDSIESGGIYSNPDSLPSNQESSLPPDYSSRRHSSLPPPPMSEMPPPPYTPTDEGAAALKPNVVYTPMGNTSPNEPLPYTNLIGVPVSSDEGETILKQTM